MNPKKLRWNSNRAGGGRPWCQVVGSHCETGENECGDVHRGFMFQKTSHHLTCGAARVNSGGIQTGQAWNWCSQEIWFRVISCQHQCWVFFIFLLIKLGSYIQYVIVLPHCKICLIFKNSCSSFKNGIFSYCTNASVTVWKTSLVPGYCLFFTKKWYNPSKGNFILVFMSSHLFHYCLLQLSELLRDESFIFV